MALNVDHLLRTAATLEQALLALELAYLADVRLLASKLPGIFDAAR